MKAMTPTGKAEGVRERAREQMRQCYRDSGHNFSKAEIEKLTSDAEDDVQCWASFAESEALLARKEVEEEYLRLAVYLHRRDEHNQYFFRCEHDICLRAARICRVLETTSLPNADYGAIHRRNEEERKP